MYMSNVEALTNFSIEIVACKPEPKNYLVEVRRKGYNDLHYTCGPNNSIGNLIARICRELEDQYKLMSLKEVVIERSQIEDGLEDE